MKSIYLDVLIVLNIYVNFFLLRATAGFTHTPLKTLRCIVSSVVGSIFSLTILLPSGNFILTLAIKLAAAAVIVVAAFGLRDKKHTAKLIFFFYIINFIFAGIIMMLYIAFKPSFMAFNNSYFYVDFSLISLVVFTAVAYFAVTAVRFFIDRGNDAKHRYRLTIKYNSSIKTIEALADTGNCLVDGFSGKPVIICSQKKLGIINVKNIQSISVDNAEELMKLGFRIIPYSTIGNSGFIPVFKPDEIIISDEETGKNYKTDALIGITIRDNPAVFNPKLLF